MPLDRARRGAELLQWLADMQSSRFVLAELNDLLTSLDADQLSRAFAAAPPASLPPEVSNYVAAMIEYACGKRGIQAPAWTRTITPLAAPFFGSKLESLRLHLLTHSPPPFRSRNIFIDTSIGGRV
ncbi:MAG: hypothetical protein ACRECQ_09650 [Burkholderiaceae bacterium]